MIEPLRILGPKFKAKRPTTRPHCKSGLYLTWVYPTNHGEMSLIEMAEYTGIPWETIATRISRNGFDDANTFSTEYHPRGHQVGAKLWLESGPRWDRKRCRRDGINCTKYSECQLQRCGIGPRWVDPGDTDRCYIEPKIIRNLYPSALAAMSHFGVVGY